MRSEAQIQKWRELSERLKSGFERGNAVWLYIPKVQPGLSRKLAHLWHGPFRFDEVHNYVRVKLKIDGTGYRVNPWVNESDDLYAELLPEDSWEINNQNDEYEVERILDLRWTKRTRTSRRTREYLVKWKGYADPEWISLSQLNSGALLYEFNQSTRTRERFWVIQAGDDHPQI
ncbi:hypothetical protein PHMEG_0005143 [Phytophthora megakarya]|uniref:Chromo domain-containing protein n=1 Tax=Phytophthora megakarya TaxID=4795 RepID=A0A225WU52_9STRA|nr:hypothetical protein PHMEG_0005143 [Phytophthora megakarya]